MKQLIRWQQLRHASLVLALLTLGGCGSPPTTTGTVTVQRGTLHVTVSGNGVVAPAQSSDLTFGVSGKIQKVFVKEGDHVQAGQMLAMLDPREFDLQVLQAEAAVASAQAKFQQVANGNATEQDKAAAQANLDEAQAELTKIKNGPATPADVAASTAQVRAAEANLRRVRTGNVTQADLDSAQAVLSSAEANLRRVRTGNVTQADLDSAQAALSSAEANLRATSAGPSAGEIDVATTQLAQAQQQYQKTASAASAYKTQCAQNIELAADQVRQAQQAYSTAYWNNQSAQSGINPETGKPFDQEPIRNAIKDPEARKQEYARALEDAELVLSQAETQLEQAKVAYENAKQQEINDLAIAQSAIDAAQAGLDTLMRGPKETDIAQAQAQVDQARAQLAKLRQGGTTADIAQAQAQVDQARAQLAKLRQGGTTADIAQAQAQVDQARAQLAKLQQGGMDTDIDIAGSKVTEAQARLEQLGRGGTSLDRDIADAVVREAEAQLVAAKLNRDNAILYAPFAGMITSVNVKPGDRVSITGAAPDTAMFTLVDLAQLHVDLNISEAGVAQVKSGQGAKVKIDAQGSQPIAATVGYISAVGSTVQNVTTYRARVDLPPNNSSIRVGMNATIDIDVAAKQDALIIPTRSIREEGDKQLVRLQNGGSLVEQEIQTGLVNDLQTEVLSGLQEGDVIALRGNGASRNE